MSVDKDTPPDTPIDLEARRLERVAREDIPGDEQLIADLHTAWTATDAARHRLLTRRMRRDAAVLDALTGFLLREFRGAVDMVGEPGASAWAQGRADTLGTVLSYVHGVSSGRYGLSDAEITAAQTLAGDR